MSDLKTVREKFEAIRNVMSGAGPTDSGVALFHRDRAEISRAVSEGLAELSRLEAQQEPNCSATYGDYGGELREEYEEAAPPVEPCPARKALAWIACPDCTYRIGYTGERVTSCATCSQLRAALASPCSPCPRCAEERERADSNYASCERIKRKFEEATAERDRLQATVKALLDFARYVAGPIPCSGRGHTEDDDGRKFTKAEQANVDRLHVQYCRRCRASALVAEHDKEQAADCAAGPVEG